MRNQYILISSLILLFIIFSLFWNTKFYMSNTRDISFFGKNLETEIYYISEHFKKEDIGDFLKIFSLYMKMSDYNFSFVCISPINLNIPSCNSSNNINCCYYFQGSILVNRSILKFCNKNFILYNEGILCICYNISSKSTYYANFICT